MRAVRLNAMAGSISDPEERAIRRADHLVKAGHTKRAAQTLHSTASMADLTQPEVREAMQRLHPPLPKDSVLPPLPANSPHTILQDDTELMRIIRSSDNGSASGPSGWGGNMLAVLAESDICRGGIVALLKDILNGSIPDAVRPYLLACRLVGLNKVGGNGVRPIAIGELFYRLAAVMAVRKVTADAAKLLSPHQYGIGVSSGAERIVHSMQYALTDKAVKRCALKLDIANAFNSCDRSLMLRKLYATPELCSLYRIADFAYCAPSPLLLQRCDGLSIDSSNGVRQGDPLACLLFCIYMRELFNAVAEEADVELFAFVDDLHVVGAPAEVMKALAALQQKLPDLKLKCNNAKSCMAYFHHDDEPLPAAIRHSLADQDIAPRLDWLEVMGVVVGRDETEIKAGVECLTEAYGGSAAFFRRLQSPLLLVQSAMLLLRQCAVPQLNYQLRCMAPSCMSEKAAEFDQTVLTAAYDKLQLRRYERTAEVERLLRFKLMHGGFGLTSAVLMSPAAYLASVAAARHTAIFAPFCADSRPLPSDTLLHGWLTDSMARMLQASPHAGQLLPDTAASYFSFYAKAKSSLSSTLQSELSKQASKHRFMASLIAAEQKRRQDGGAAIAHARAISATYASAWKRAAPTQPMATLTDSAYRISARLNLRLTPFSASADTPDHCKLCGHGAVIARDPWHALVCNSRVRKEVFRRHNAVAAALCHAVLLMGGQAVREPKGLHVEDGRRPDIQIVFPGVHLLTDVVVSHPLRAGVTSEKNTARLGIARHAQAGKHKSYDETAARQDAVLLPFSVETCGGMAEDAVDLLDRIATAGAEHLAFWSHNRIVQHLLAVVAVAIQKGNAMTVLRWQQDATVRASVVEE